MGFLSDMLSIACSRFAVFLPYLMESGWALGLPVTSALSTTRPSVGRCLNVIPSVNTYSWFHTTYFPVAASLLQHVAQWQARGVLRLIVDHSSVLVPSRIGLTARTGRFLVLNVSPSCQVLKTLNRNSRCPSLTDARRGASLSASHLPVTVTTRPASMC